MFGAGYEAVTGFFDNIIKGITDWIDDIESNMHDAGTAAVNSFTSVFSPLSQAGAKANKGVFGFGGYLANRFVKGTGTGSYNPKTGYAGEWMIKSVPMAMENEYPSVSKAVKDIGSRLANIFVDSATGEDKTNNKGSVLSRLANSVREKLGLDTIMDDIKSRMGLDTGYNFDDWLDNYGVDTDDFAITPVIDMSEIDSGLEDISDKFGSTDYDLGLSTSSDLASSIGSYDNSVFTGSSSSTDLSVLTTEVQKISEKINRLEVRIDSGTLVGAIVDKMNSSLGERQILAGRGVLT